MSKKLKESFDEYEYSDFDDDSVKAGKTFIEDGYEFEWVEPIEDPVHLDFDNWQIWSAKYHNEPYKEGIQYFVVDTDTGFIDWGPCDTETEAREFLASKVDDWENDLYEKKNSKESDEDKELCCEVINQELDVSEIDVDSIEPTDKDFERADGLSFRGSTFRGNGRPFGSEASKMAKLIRDPYKLVRRAKAIASIWGTYTGYFSNMGYYHWVDADKETDAWSPFLRRLKEMGFTEEQIDKIANYEKSDVKTETMDDYYQDEPFDETDVEESYYDSWLTADPVEQDIEHCNLYGGDRTFCPDCGTKLQYGNDGYSYCPVCFPEEDYIYDECTNPGSVPSIPGPHKTLGKRTADGKKWRYDASRKDESEEIDDEEFTEEDIIDEGFTFGRENIDVDSFLDAVDGLDEIINRIVSLRNSDWTRNNIKALANEILAKAQDVKESADEI